jgi:hypothetical protein
MFEAGKLLRAGPFTDGGNLCGVGLQVGLLEEAKALADANPALKAGRLEVEVHPWYSAKGIRTDQSPKKAWAAFTSQRTLIMVPGPAPETSPVAPAVHS